MFELLFREELGKDVRDVFLGGNVNKFNDNCRGLLAEPRHPDAEVTVASRNDMIFNHCDGGLVVLKNDTGVLGREADLLKHTTEP